MRSFACIYTDGWPITWDCTASCLFFFFLSFSNTYRDACTGKRRETDTRWLASDCNFTLILDRRWSPVEKGIDGRYWEWGLAPWYVNVKRVTRQWFKRNRYYCVDSWILQLSWCKGSKFLRKFRIVNFQFQMLCVLHNNFSINLFFFSLSWNEKLTPPRQIKLTLDRPTLIWRS